MPLTALALFLGAATASALTPATHWRPQSVPTLPPISQAAARPKEVLPLVRRLAVASLALSTASRPAIAAAAKATVPFTLLGRTSSALFPIQNLSLLSWSLLVILPRWQQTKVLALVAPVIHSVLYALLLVHAVRFPVPGLAVSFSSLEGIMPAFSLPDGAFTGWLHYCVFDPLVGYGIVLDADQQRIPHLLCVPCLVMTLFAGPVGFLSYLSLRTAVLVLRRQGVLKPGAKRLMRPKLVHQPASAGKAGLTPTSQASNRDVDADLGRVDASQRDANAAKVMNVLFTGGDEEAWAPGQQDEQGPEAKNVQRAMDALWSSGPSFGDDEEQASGSK